MLILNETDVRKVYTMKDAVEACKEALRIYTQGGSTTPLRTNVQAENGQNLFMPAYIKEIDRTGIKIVSVFPDNPKLGKPSVPAQVILLDEQTGEVCTMIDGTFLTQFRTGAVQGAGTDLLARKDAKNAVLIGAGGQARGQLEAMLTVRDLDQVAIIDYDQAVAEKFVASYMAEFPETTAKLYVSEDHDADISNADIITACTTSNTPVFDASLVKPGTHINGIGAYTPAMKELPGGVLSPANKMFVDTKDGVFAEAGEVIASFEAGETSEADYHELGELVLDPKLGRSNDEEITVFDSVGSAVLDVMVAHEIYEKSKGEKVGTEI